MKLQVPVTHKINHLLNFLHNHSSSIPLNLCKWTVLFLSLLATILILRFRQKSPSLPPLLVEDDFSDDEISSPSSSSSSSEFDDDSEEEVEEEEQQNRAGIFFRCAGNGDAGFLRNCRSIGDIFSLLEIANSKSVVKLWDTIGFGLGFGLDDSDSSDERSIVSVYGADEKKNAPSSSASGNLALRIWDTRLRRRIPAVIAEWAPDIGKRGGIDNGAGGVQKVFVRDDGRYEMTVGEMRNGRSPLEEVTESQLDLLWPNSYMLNI